MFCRSSRILVSLNGERSLELEEVFGGEVAPLLHLPSLCIIISTIFRQKRHLFTFVWCFLLPCVILFHKRSCCIWLLVSNMAAKMKGIYKGFKCISQIFVEKDREMEIGYPTDVKHVAHIGWDGSSSGSAPSWMSEFKAGSALLSPRPSSFCNPRYSNSFGFSTGSSQEFEQAMGHQSMPDMFRDIPPTDLPDIPKKPKRKKKSSSSTSSSSPKFSSMSSRSSRSKSNFKASTSLQSYKGQ